MEGNIYIYKARDTLNKQYWTYLHGKSSASLVFLMAAYVDHDKCSWESFGCHGHEI